MSDTAAVFTDNKPFTRNYWLYILLLEQGKYYVGITSRKYAEDRISEHFNGFYAARWTRKYKPVEVNDKRFLYETTKEEAEKVERRVTREYMKKYGYQNVRGGDLSYSGKYFKIGKHFIRGNLMLDMSTAVMLFTMSFYILFTSY